MTHEAASPMQIIQVPTGPLGPVGWDPDDHIYRVLAGAAGAADQTTVDQLAALTNELAALTARVAALEAASGT